jgi:hypothetical protein
LFLTVAGAPVDDATLRAVVREAAFEAGIATAVSPTSLRNTSCALRRAQTRRVENGERATVSI